MQTQERSTETAQALLLEPERFIGLNVEKDVAEAVTQRTLDYLQRREEEAPGSVSWVIVYFRYPEYGEGRDRLEWMQTADYHRGNRWTRYRIAQAQAEVQRGVYDFLTNRAETQEFFKSCPLFKFDFRRHVRSFPVINALAVTATSALVKELSDRDEVLMVQTNFAIEPLDRGVPVIAQTDIHVPPTAAAAHRDGYTWGWHRLELPAIHASGLTGRISEDERMVIGVIDSGVCEDHSDLCFKVRDFIKVDASGRVANGFAFDSGYHGTFCAGVMVGANNSGVRIGGAPDAVITAASVLDGGCGSAVRLIQALEWLSVPDHFANVINLSLGIKTLKEEDRQALELAFERLSLMGIVCVAAVGNDPRYTLYPARFDNVFSVGAIGPEGEAWAKSGLKPDLVCPGHHIFSCLPPGDPDLDCRSYQWQSGTSVAAAHLSALVALFMQARPSAGPRLIREAFKRTAKGGGTYDERYGWGEPDFFRALQYSP